MKSKMFIKPHNVTLLSRPLNYLLMRRSSKIKNQEQRRSQFEMCINRVQLLGRVGCDPEKKGPDQGVMFSLATTYNYHFDNGEFLQRTDWHKILCSKLSLRETVLNSLKKGHRVYVNGLIMNSENQNDNGIKPKTSFIMAEDVIFLS